MTTGASRRPRDYESGRQDRPGSSRVRSSIRFVSDGSRAQPRWPTPLPPGIHAAYAPTQNIHPGDSITFKVRTSGTTDGNEIWDFGDGSAAVQVRSDGNVKALAPDRYAITTHRFSKPGDYLTRVERADRHGRTATARLHVRVE